ncbi:MAG: divalent cation tolerance protein CutA [Patescibacteria group bacterium]
MKLLWLLVNCNSVAEAKRIGDISLRARLTVCYNIFPRLLTRFFWPPKTGKIERGKGCLLVMDTLPKHLKKLQKLVQSKHSDQVPFIGTVEISNVNLAYYKWFKGELKN